jgi:DeoR family fructose operon transcriptional repressor
MTADDGAEATLRYRGAAARRERILEIVREASFCPATELSERLGVSAMTIRRDIRQLTEDGLVRSIHGGVSAITAPIGGVDFQLRAKTNLRAKQAIARRAAALLRERPQPIIGLDAGTSVYEMVSHLPAHERLTVVTHSLPVLVALSSNDRVEVIALGGVLHAETQAFAGPATVRQLSELRMGTVFLAASAVRDGVIFCGNAFDADTKRAMVAAADEVILLADSSKFTLPAVFSVGPVDLADRILVDDALPASEQETLRRAGATVDVVPLERD